MILRWLLPIGFVGLVAIGALLIVYLLRPQYREKRVSATTIWKRVVSQTKKPRPTLSNLLIFFVQALVLAIIAVGFAEPRLYSETVIAADSEMVLILDSSASMRAISLNDKVARFEKAKNEIKKEINEFFTQAEEGVVSLIIADASPSYLLSDIKKSDKDEMISAIDALECTLEESDLEEAINLAGKRVEINPYAKIFIYTDTEIASLGDAVEVINLSDKTNEQNIAILGCDVAIVDNQYTFEVHLGAYGDITRKCNMSFDIKGADNGSGPRNLHLSVPVAFASSETTSSLEQTQSVTIVATNEQYGGQEDWFFETYDEVEIFIPDLNDSIPDDDRYFVYSGLRDKIKVEYWSDNANSFWQLAFNNLSTNMNKTRAITFHEVYTDMDMKAENSGFEFYIFEHSIPQEILDAGLPKDGVVLLVDPDETINQTDIGITFDKVVSLDKLTPCQIETAHPLTQHLKAERINLTKYSQVTVQQDSKFQPLMLIDNNPILLVKNTQTAKFVVMPFSINMSDFYGDQFQIFIYNLINYFMPVTLSNNDFNLGEKVQINCKGDTVEVKHGEDETVFVNFPAQITFDKIGTYTFTTTFGIERENEIRRAYVHVSTQESNLFRRAEFKITLNNKELAGEEGKDFFIWLAVASLILMVIEWYLQFKYIL